MPPGQGRFAYYDRLSAAHKAIYRRSDAIPRIDLPDAPALAPLVVALDAALLTGRRKEVGAAVKALSAAICTQLGAPPVRILVREVRPATEEAELHGLYTFGTEGQLPKLEVWMRTAAKASVVKFRTFLRTFLHEMCHHLDVTVLALEESFHTEGFFRRESSLVRQLVPPKDEPPPPDERQLKLFG